MSVDDKLLSIFRQEAGERLDAMVATLLEVESGGGDPESVRELFRHAHSLKGTAGMVGLAPIAAVATSIEDVLAEARSRGELEMAAAGPLLRATDAIRAAMQGEAIDAAAVAAELHEGPGDGDGEGEGEGEALGGAVPVTAAPPAPLGDDHDALPSAPSRMATMRVSAERVDDLLDAAGEAVLRRRRLEHMLGPVVEEDEQLREELDRSETLLAELQHAVLDLRTMPLSSIVSSFRAPSATPPPARAARSSSSSSASTPSSTARSVEGISDMIVHLLRNAVSHGIEPPDAREAAGKPRRGTVTVSAEARGNRVEVSVADDGRGIAPDLVARTQSHAELGELFATPGLSTAREVGELAGRGVGLDAVQRDLKKLGGVLLVTSDPGRGSRFTLRLPATLAVLALLLVERGGQHFGIPLQTLAEVVDEERVVVLGGRPAVELEGGEVLPLADLAVLLDRPGMPTAPGGPGR